jgi:hypothetical protein
VVAKGEHGQRIDSKIGREALGFKQQPLAFFRSREVMTDEPKLISG